MTVGSETAGPTAPSSAATDGATLAGRLANLSLDKRALLERLLLERRAGGSLEGSQIPRRTGPGPWPLSHAQELMWLLDQLSPGSNAYNSPTATRLEGPLDPNALRLAIDAVVARNEVLRTTYDTVDGQPVQLVHPPSPTELPVVDLSDLPPAQRQAELDRVLQEEAERPFDLRVGKVLRPTLVRLGPEDHVLLWVVHHIAIDGWSKGVLWRELTSCYDALGTGRASDLPELPLQYADWAAWHRSWLEAGVLDEQLGYWRRQLAGAPTQLALPTDHRRPPVRSGRGDRRDALFPLETVEGLRRLARAEGATLFMVLVAAFGALLGRFSGQDEVVVGTPIAGRNRVDIEDLVGYFMNTVALRLDLSGDPSFRQLVARARATTVAAFAHQDAPFERVVAEVNPPRDLSRTPIFQVMLVLHNERRSDVAPAGLRASRLRHERGWAKFDLTVGMGERPHGLNTGWEFSTDLFEAPTIERMMRSFAVLLEEIVIDPDRPLSALPVLPHDERRLLQAWEDGGPALGAGRSLPDLVVDRAGGTPEAAAIRDADRTWTYADLVHASGRLAGRLLDLGVGEDVRVAVCAERSADLVIALLAVLRAGGTCVPLDPTYPVERLRTMLADSDPAVVLAQPPLLSGIPVDGRPVVLLGDLVLPVGPADQASTGGCRPVAIPTESPAYLLYTSGSTGRPKGVVLPHAGLVNHALAAVDLYRLGPGDRMLQFASPSFDISLEEIFATLAGGACVVPRPIDLPLAGPELLDWLERERITVLDLPTAYWQEWVRDLVARGLPLPASLRLVVVGGEKASASAYAAWRALAGDRVAWINTYGPTETSVVATAWQPESDRLAEDEEPPIGRPLPGVRVRVLDRHGNRVPIGVPGELHIGGIGLARGYLHDRELTEGRFAPDPELPGGRLYRTGDLVRWSPTGALQYAGRSDGQVKLRGFRIEPAEVEATLSTHPRVAASVARVAGSTGGEQLVAYAVVADPAEPRLARALREHLAERLPAYLVPTAVIPVQSLPLTENGKLDADALPAPTPAARADERPRDDVERRLHDVWCSVLGLESVGVNESFFDLGGHSLLAVRLFARLERELGQRLPLATLIAAPSIAELAAVIRRERPAPSWDSLVPLQPGGVRTPLFLLHEPNGLVLVYRDLVRRLGEDQAVYGLQSVGLDRRRQPLTRIPDMAAHYVKEIRSVQPHGPYLLGGFCYGGVLALEMAHQLQQAGEEVGLVALFDATPFGHGSGRWPNTLMGRAQRRWRLFLTAGAGKRLQMVPETGRRVLTRSLIDRKRPLPRVLRDVSLVNWLSMRGYRTPEYRGRVTLFVQDVGPGVDVERRRRLWSGVAGNLDVRTVVSAGVTHLTMLAEPHVAQLARELRAATDEAWAQRQ